MTDLETTQLSEAVEPDRPCQFPDGCPNPPTKGAYIIPKAPGEKRFPYMILCKEHGEMAIVRGARKITYRPKAANK